MINFYQNQIERKNGIEKITPVSDRNIIGVEDLVGTYHYDSDDILVTSLNGQIIFRKYIRVEEDNTYYACDISAIDELTEESMVQVSDNTSFEVLSESEFNRLKRLNNNNNTRTNLLLEMESLKEQLSDCQNILYEERRKRILSMARQCIK